MGLIEKEIVERLKNESERYYSGGNFDHWEIDLLLEKFSPYASLRLLADNPANLDLDVTWDFSPLVQSGWAVREEFNARVLPADRFLIVTEGSSDAKIIQHAIKVLRPHVADFFSFVDMEEGYPFSGSGNLYKFTQGLISIGIQNSAMQLPHLDVFSNFTTEGPTGRSSADINGRAAAIECYLELSAPGLP